MSAVYEINTLEEFDRRKKEFINYLSELPSELKVYLWNSYENSINFYLSKETLVDCMGNNEDLLCKVDTKSFSGVLFFPFNKSILSIDKRNLGKAICDKLNSLVPENSDITYSYEYLEDPLNGFKVDINNRRALDYILTFPLLAIRKHPIEKSSGLYLRFYYPCNAILLVLEIEDDNEFFLSKREIIDTLVSVFNDSVKET